MKKIVLKFANGKKFYCKSLGLISNFEGNIVFNTSNVGYVESFTDPSYLNQILVLNTVNVGNVGFRLNDIESCRFFISGVLVRSFNNFYSNKNSKCSILKILKKKRIFVIEYYDINSIVHEIKKNNLLPIKIKVNNIKKYVVKKISNKFYSFSSFNVNKKKKLLFLDFGSKFSILKELSNRNNFLISITNKIIKNYFKYKPDGIVLSNGPGDARKKKKEIIDLKKIIGLVPILGICLGHQIISQCLGLKIKKMKFGHHSINHPIKFSNLLFISSQNHNYFVVNKKYKNQPYSLLDKTNQGLYIKKKRIITTQGHPESSPGPTDFSYIFDIFEKFLIK